MLLELTDEQIDKLVDSLDEHHDEGPSGRGWKSIELTSLIEVIRGQLDE